MIENLQDESLKVTYEIHTMHQTVKQVMQDGEENLKTPISMEVVEKKLGKEKEFITKVDTLNKIF